MSKMLMEEKTGQVLACSLSVELPGIESGTKIVLTCGNADIRDAKRREKYVNRPADTPKGVDGVNNTRPVIA